MFHTEHCVTIDAPIQLVYDVLADVEGYATLFPYTQAVTLLESSPDYQIARFQVDVSGKVQSWTSRRDLDNTHRIIYYKQLQTAPLVESMGGEWRCYSLRETQTQLVITHDFAVRAAVDGLVAGQFTPEKAEEMLRSAVERNSTTELEVLKQEIGKRALALAASSQA